ncbi:MAG: aminoacyl-tRNA hydrolase [Actinomycetota bacterium]|nr:aminoacyl-tRNA hydrolase [Actinomycetota bacterium]
MFGRSRSSDHEEGRWVVVGLGNPGGRYAKTRHNIGVITIELLLERTAARFKRHKSGCLVAEANLGGERAVIARTTSFMNESGRSVGELVRWYRTDPRRLIVAHDELDIPFGEIRIKEGGGTAGHNGLGSLVSHLGTKDFNRVRVGIGRPRGAKDAGDHVLAAFSSSERKELEFVLNDAAAAVERIIEVGVERAMNEVNTRTTP